VGTASKLIGVLNNIEPQIQKTEMNLADSQKKVVDLSLHSNDPFPKEAELQAALKRQTEINTELGLNKDNAQATEAIEESNENEKQVEAEGEAIDEIEGQSYEVGELTPVASEPIPVVVEQPDVEVVAPGQAIETVVEPQIEPAPDVVKEETQVDPIASVEDASEGVLEVAATEPEQAIAPEPEQIVVEVEEVTAAEPEQEPEQSAMESEQAVESEQTVEAELEQGVMVESEPSVAVEPEQSNHAASATTQMDLFAQSEQPQTPISEAIPPNDIAPAVSARSLELQQAEAILRIAAIAYAHAGSRGQIQFDGEFWTAKGKHYDISYNPSNENFFVIGKDGSQMEAQSIGEMLDPDCCGDISPEDVTRFQKTEEFLLSLQSTFDPSLLPAQTQAIAQKQLEAVEDSTEALADELNTWHKQATELGRPENYLQRIEQVQSAVEQGEPLTEKAIQAMNHDQEAWKQQASSVLSDAIAILDCVGIQDDQGKHFNGKTYQVSLATTGVLRVSATERGELMQVQAGKIISASVTKADLEQFHQFVNYLQSAANLLKIQERSSSARERSP
jgi:hypothetical protein